MAALPPDWDISGGAMEISLVKLALDIYPYHLAAGSRTYWVRYNDRSQCHSHMMKVLEHYRMLIASKLGGCYFCLVASSFPLPVRSESERRWRSRERAQSREVPRAVAFVVESELGGASGGRDGVLRVRVDHEDGEPQRAGQERQGDALVAARRSPLPR